MERVLYFFISKYSLDTFSWWIRISYSRQEDLCIFTEIHTCILQTETKKNVDLSSKIDGKFAQFIDYIEKNVLKKIIPNNFSMFPFLFVTKN